MTFQVAWLEMLKWDWRLRATYPTKEIYPQDDDVQSAHRQGNYHPNLVGMHCFYYNGILYMYGRMSFGDTMSCPTFDVISQARQKAAQYFWLVIEIGERSMAYLPSITIVHNTTPPAERNFAHANINSKNPSVINADGSRRPPPYHHHVDDALYGDIAEYVPRGLAASKTGLYRVLGFPSGNQPDPFSDQKCKTEFTHQRQILGHMIDTRRMTVALPIDQRLQFIITLDKWAASKDFTLLEASSPFGTMSSICDIAKWSKPYLFTVQNLLARAIQAAYKAHCTKHRIQSIRQAYTAVLSSRLIKQLEPLVASHIARAIYNSRTRIHITAAVKTHLTALASYLRVPDNPWETPIGHLVPRDAFADTKSDMSEYGIGFQCEKLKIYGVVQLTADTHRRCLLEPGDPKRSISTN